MPDLIDLGGVWAYIADTTRPGASNSGIIADDDGLTIVDAQLTPRLGAELLALVEGFGLPIRRLAPVSYTHLTLPTICSV